MLCIKVIQNYEKIYNILATIMSKTKKGIVLGMNFMLWDAFIRLQIKSLFEKPTVFLIINHWQSLRSVNTDTWPVMRVNRNEPWYTFKSAPVYFMRFQLLAPLLLPLLDFSIPQGFRLSSGYSFDKKIITPFESNFCNYSSATSLS